MTFGASYLGQLRALVGTRPLIVPGFRAIIERPDQNILLLRRADTGLWGLPSGSMELGESAPEMVKREIWEETGLTLDSFDMFGVASDPTHEHHTYPHGDHIQNFSLLVVSRNWSGEPEAKDGEATGFSFIDPGTLPPPDTTVRPEMRTIAAYRDYRDTGAFQWV